MTLGRNVYLCHQLLSLIALIRVVGRLKNPAYNVEAMNFVNLVFGSCIELNYVRHTRISFWTRLLGSFEHESATKA